MTSLYRRSNRLFFSLRQLRRYLYLFCILLAPIYKELGQFLRCCASEMSWLRRINPYFTARISTLGKRASQLSLSTILVNQEICDMHVLRLFTVEEARFIWPEQNVGLARRLVFLLVRMRRRLASIEHTAPRFATIFSNHRPSSIIRLYDIGNSG